MIKRVGIIGMGALGMLYGDFIAKNITREAVTFIVDEKRKKAYQETVFTINGEKVLFNLVEYFNAVPFDLIIKNLWLFVNILLSKELLRSSLIMIFL